MSQQSQPALNLQHEIFVLDAYLEKFLDATKAKTISRKVIDALLKALDMEELGPLQIYDAVDLRAPGWSFIVPITTSHISAHYFEKPGRQPNIRMDIYSCKNVDWKRVINVLDEHLGLADWRGNFIHREMEEEDAREILDIKGVGTTVTSQSPLVSLQDFAMQSIKDTASVRNIEKVGV